MLIARPELKWGHQPAGRPGAGVGGEAASPRGGAGHQREAAPGRWLSKFVAGTVT